MRVERKRRGGSPLLWRTSTTTPITALFAALIALWIAVAVGGCAGTTTRPVTSGHTTEDGSEAASNAASNTADDASTTALMRPGEPMRFSLRTTRGREVTHGEILGKPTVIAFVSTFDWASQAQARFVASLTQPSDRAPNCLAIAIEQDENRVLVESFAKNLSLPYPVAHVPTEKLKASSFRGVTMVPTIWILDEQARVVWKHHGLTSEEQLREVLNKIR